MSRKNYSLEKTHTALQQLDRSLRALLYSGHMTNEQQLKVYDAYELISKVSREFRWDHLERLEPETYARLVADGTYQRYLDKKTANSTNSV